MWLLEFFPAVSKEWQWLKYQQNLLSLQMQSTFRIEMQTKNYEPFTKVYDFLSFAYELIYDVNERNNFFY